jgi:predicted nucleic acid-binding protein
MYLIDANIILEVLYKRDRWRECSDFLAMVKRGIIKAYILHFTLHGISAILGKPELALKFLSEIITWHGLIIVDSSIEDEIMACELANKVGLDFDDGLQYYYAKKLGVNIVSLDKDFDKTDLRRLEPMDILKSLKANT